MQTSLSKSQGALGHHFDELDVDLRRLLMLMWRRKWIIVAFVLVAMILALATTIVLPTKYTGQALIMIQNDNLNDKNSELKNLLTNMKLDTTLILSEVEVIKSREVARRVIERLNLLNDNSVNKEAPAVPDKTNFKSLSVIKDNSLTPKAPKTSAAMERAIDSFLTNLDVRPISGSYVIQLEYTSPDARRAALITNTIIDVYFEQRLEEKFRATQKVSSWLDNRMGALRDQVREAEQAVEQYRAQKNLIEGARYEITAQQLSELNSKLVTAKASEAEAESRMHDLQSNENAVIADDNAQVVGSRLLQDLKRTETDLLRKKAELSSQYGPRHPNMININAEIANLRGKISEEKGNVVGALRNELKIARANVAALEAQLDEVESLKKSENEDMIALRELEREAESSRTIYENFAAAYKRTDQQEQLQEPEARVLSYAAVPERPSFPNKPLIMSLTAIVALFLGITFVLILEKLDNAFRSASQLEQRTGYPCYGLIPVAEGAGKGGLADYVINKPASAVSESVRTLRMVLNLRAGQDQTKRPKVVTITSSLPSEGKTTLSAWLARTAAKSGEKVIVIDCDLRRPNLHRIMRKSNDVTLVDYLTGDMKLDKIVQKDDTSGAHVIYARAVNNSALDLISSEKMRTLIASLKQAYDLVILDTPACLAVSDARILANESDFTLYIVEWDKTPREVVTTGAKQFSDFGYDNMAFVLTSVDVRRHARYGYGDTAYYYGRFKEYYQS
ncbi:MAG: GumC family protein [Pseudobdellovibrionaceae bacterium]